MRWIRKLLHLGAALRRAAWHYSQLSNNLLPLLRLIGDVREVGWVENNPAVFNFALWQVTQYLENVALTVAVAGGWVSLAARLPGRALISAAAAATIATGRCRIKATLLYPCCCPDLLYL